MSSISVEVLPEFIHYSVKSSEYLYNHYFKLFRLLNSISFTCFLEVLSYLLFGAYLSVSSFCLAFCVCFYELGEISLSPRLEGLALYKMAPE